MLRKILVAAVLIASVAIVPTATASPASADIGSCNDSGQWFGPYWWGSVGATNGGIPYGYRNRMVLTADDWYGGHILRDGNPNQMWYMDCIGYDYGQGSRIIQFRLASDPNRCLTANDYYAGTTLDYCQDNPYSGQAFEQWGIGEYYVDFEGYPVWANAFYSPTYGQCLDVFNADWWDYTQTIIWDCHFGDNQLWY